MKNLANNTANKEKRIDSIGIKSLIRNNVLPISELPGLKIVLDKFTKSLTVDLFFSSSAVDKIVKITNISYINFADYINQKVNSTIAVIVKVEELDDHFLISIDRRFTDIMIELLVGGWKAKSSSQAINKSYTDIEKKIAEYIFNIMIKNLKIAFSFIKKFTFKIEQLIELNPNLSVVFQLSDTVMFVEIEAGILQKGIVELIFPVSILESIMYSLHKPFAVTNLKKGSDIWFQHFYDVLNEVDLEVKVILGYCNVEVDDLLNLKVDDLLSLKSITNEEGEVLVKINDVEVFIGKSGSVNEKIGVEINKVLKVISQNKS